MKVLGVVMAGGRNLRYGGLKAFAEVDGVPIVERVIAALRSVSDDVVVIANDAEAYAPLGLPIRSDEVSNGAALAGLLTALHWSIERNRDGVVVVACDMPFASGALLQELIDTARREVADVAAPASAGPRGVEPLCAFYSNRCTAAIEAALANDDLRMIGFYEQVKVTTLPLERVRQFGEPDALFMNVNTHAELDAAQRIAGELSL